MSKDSDLVEFFNRHVVTLIFTFQRGSDTHSVAVTAIVFSVSDQWFLITAGHCIRQIEEIPEQTGYKLIQCQLIDSLGAGASHLQAIPFLYEASHPVCLSDDYAFDYGVMVLSPYYRKLLELNNIQALNEEVWKKQPSSVDFYTLLGIPSELVIVDADSINIGTTLIGVKPLDKKPKDFTEVDTPLFYGHIELDEGLKSIQGMSGGPIFAFRKNEKGELKYWLTALQSRWLPESHDIAACPTKLLGHFLEDQLSKITKVQP